MRAGPLETLHKTARSLPGDLEPVRLATVLHAPAAPATTATVTLADLDGLDRRVAAWLLKLSQRLEPALAGVLARAVRAWDQADSLAVLDAALLAEAAALRAAFAPLLADAAGQPRALQALLAIEAATGLVRLCETRLATLIRLRGSAELFPDGRPFLDLAGALAEMARRWS